MERDYLTASLTDGVTLRRAVIEDLSGIVALLACQATLSRPSRQRLADTQVSGTPYHADNDTNIGRVHTSQSDAASIASNNASWPRTQPGTRSTHAPRSSTTRRAPPVFGRFGPYVG